MAGDAYMGPVNAGTITGRLAVARVRLQVLAELNDPQLAFVPPAGCMRFADGRRTLEQVIEGMLKHQRRHHETIAAALADQAGSAAPQEGGA